MKKRYAEIPEREAPVSERLKRFTRNANVSAATRSSNDMFAYEQYVPRGRKPKELTTFSVVMLLIVAAVVITGYISNIVRVDQLMVDITATMKEEQALQQQRESLRAEINMLSSYGRIQKIATEELGLVHASQQPYSLTVYGLPQSTEENR